MWICEDRIYVLVYELYLVDFYGVCLKNKEGLIGLYGKVDNWYVFKDYKFILLKYYKFFLVFMN